LRIKRSRRDEHRLSEAQVEKRTSINSIRNIHKEKEMADFRKWLMAFAVVALLLGLGVSASAQTGQPFTCTAQAANPPWEISREAGPLPAGRRAVDPVVHCSPWRPGPRPWSRTGCRGGPRRYGSRSRRAAGRTARDFAPRVGKLFGTASVRVEGQRSLLRHSPSWRSFWSETAWTTDCLEDEGVI